MKKFFNNLNVLISERMTFLKNIFLKPQHNLSIQKILDTFEIYTPTPVFVTVPSQKQLELYYGQAAFKH